ncbi:MAG: hypothetical protein JSV44_05415 [Candidatus Zixiibacteriota bacterium]|nr:MAG: hypothetical protein JSV44_05415 [candidate division Zixibacteria bacterium]
MMENLIGKITASLVEKDQIPITGLIDQLNKNINPPEPVGPEEVYIRAMYIISDQINSYGGRFPSDEHDRLVELLIDSPVLIGHRKDSLPIARNFYAEKVYRKDANWVKVYFYWLKDAELGEDLRRNIDAGIYKECSISFIFNFPECTVCGRDIRECPHRPFVQYDTPAGKQPAAFNYRRIEKVLETSLVYRGSVDNTAVTRALYFFKSCKADESLSTTIQSVNVRKRIWDSGRIDRAGAYLVMPAYESGAIVLRRDGDGITAHGLYGRKLDFSKLDECLAERFWPEGDYILDCRLIGYRGKERQKVCELVKYLEGKNSAVKRLDVKVIDLIALNGHNFRHAAGEIRRAELVRLFCSHESSIIPAEKFNGDDLANAIGRCTTRYGIELHECASDRRYLLTHRKLVPCLIKPAESADGNGAFAYTCMLDGESILLHNTAVAKDELIGGGMTEFEVYSVGYTGDRLELTHPRIFDHCGILGSNDDISLLLPSHAVNPSRVRYTVHEQGDSDLLVTVNCKDESECLIIRNFSEDLLRRRSRFVADRETTAPPESSIVKGGGDVLDCRRCQDGMVLELDGFLNGTFLLRPIILNNSRRWLFYRVESFLIRSTAA